MKTNQTSLATFSTLATLTLVRMVIFSAVLLIGLSAAFVTSTAHADQLNPESRPWAEGLLSASRSNHLRLTTVEPVSRALSSDVRAQLVAIAEDQAQIWGDTILEGDYIADGEVEVEAIESMHIDSDFVGYRVTYSSVAYDTSACDPSADKSACSLGRIVESSFVSPELDSWVRDEEGFADFIPLND